MRLIEPVKAVEVIADYFDRICDTENSFDESELLRLMESNAEVDAVLVIRCKDCRHHYYHELLKQDYCEIPNMQFGEIDPNGYCHRAERKGDGKERTV